MSERQHISDAAWEAWLGEFPNETEEDREASEAEHQASNTLMIHVEEWDELRDELLSVHLKLAARDRRIQELEAALQAPAKQVQSFTSATSRWTLDPRLGWNNET